jgi:hypothetical protein
MKKHLIVALVGILLLIVSDTFGQSLFLKDGEYGLGADIGMSVGSISSDYIRNINGLAASVGLAIAGRADIGFAYTKSNAEVATPLWEGVEWNKKTEKLKGIYANLSLYKKDYGRTPKNIYLGGTYLANDDLWAASIGIFIAQKIDVSRKLYFWIQTGIALAGNKSLKRLKEFNIYIGLPFAVESREDHFIFTAGPAFDYSMTKDYSGFTISFDLGLIFLFNDLSY